MITGVLVVFIQALAALIGAMSALVFCLMVRP